MFKGSVGILMVVLLIASVFVPVEIPYTFNTTAKVYPLQQWVLHKNVDGNLIKTLHNYKTGRLAEYATFPFDRGDVVNIKFHPDQSATTSQIDSGYLVASIASLNLAQQLVDLENQLNVERANLEKVSTGQKQEIIVQGKEVLNQAIADLKFKEANLNRAEKMFNDGLLAKAKLETAQQGVKQAKIAIEVARKNIGVDATGEKPEEINLIKAKIKSFESQINFLKGTNDSYDIYAPISGNMHYETGVEGDKLIIDDIREHILIVPIKLKDRDFIGDDTVIELEIHGSDTLVQAQLIDLSDKVEIINREVVVMAKAAVSADKTTGLASGMPIKCKITTGKVLPIEYMKRSMKIDSK